MTTPAPTVSTGELDAPDLAPAALRPGVLREIAAIILWLGAIFVALCLATREDGLYLIGPVGMRVSGVLRFIFGHWVAWGAPAAMAVVGAMLLFGRDLPRFSIRIVGLFGLVVSVCGLLALAGADAPELKQTTFDRAGALGVFIVNADGLGAAWQLGLVGASLALGGMALISFLLASDLLLGVMLAGARRRWLAWRDGARENRQAREAEEQSPLWRSRLFPPSPGALRAGAPVDGMDEVDNMDEEIEGEPPLPSGPPKFVDGFSPLPTSTAAGLDSLWDDEEEAPPKGKGRDSAKPAATPRATPPIDIDKAEERMFARTSGKGGASAVAETSNVHDDGTDDDPLFDSADKAKQVGIAAATGNSKGSGASAARRASEDAAADESASTNYQSYRLPPVEALDDPPKVDNRMTREELLEISQVLEKTLADFGIEAKVIQVTQGPVVTRFELKPAAGVKVSRITSLEQDISMALRATNPVRIIAPIPGKAAVGIEVPNRRRAGVYLKELVSCDEFWSAEAPLTFGVGKTIEGQPHFCDLAKMPHMLIAGATGTGKSVCINAIICSILYRAKPDRVKFLFVDPKRVELALYADIPHLVAPVVCDPKRAAGALAWAVEQMEERYEQLVEMGQRNIDGYNQVVANPEKHPRARGRRLQPMPHMVIILDELADLMVVAKADVEESIQRLAQMARAVGIHLIVATQRPSVNVITGVIKANFPARIAFQVSSKADSRVIMDVNGAETLLGRGDMLFHPGGAPKPQRIQGAFVSEAEVDRLVTFIKEQAGPNYVVEEFQPLRDEKGKPIPRGEALLGMDGGMEPGAGYDGDDGEELAAMRRGTNRTMGSVGASGAFMPHAGGSAWAGDDEIDEALVRAAARLILENHKASVSLLQRRLKVGFARAGRLMDMLEEIGIVGPFQGSKPRDILVDPDAFLARMDAHEADKGVPAGQET